MAMLPFCGYNMADYFQHWLDMGIKGGATDSDSGGMPKIFYVNWFRRAEDGHWLWPGFGENCRVLKWVCERCDNEGDVVETPIGLLPTHDAIDRTGLDVPDEDMTELLRVDLDEWQQKIALFREHFAQFGDKLPAELSKQLDALEERLNAAK